MAALFPAAARAQAAPVPAAAPGLGDIVVTATKTGETQLQKTPLAVTVFSDEKLQLTNTHDIAGLAQLSPSLNVSAVTASAAIYIRGIGTNNVFNGAEPNVALEIDGVYIARAFEQFGDFFDVDRIEVLRGPQGTTFGRNAVGGVVNIISRKPGDTLDGKVELTGGNYSLFQGQGYVSGPIVPGLLSASIAGNYESHSPYEDNVAPGKHGVANANHGGGRLQLRLTPAPWLDATTRADYGRSDEWMQSYDHLLAPFPAVPPFAAANATVGQFHQVDLDFPGRLHTRNWGVSEDVNADLGSGFALRSITAYRDGRYRLSLDADATDKNIAQIFQGEHARQFSQELNLTGKFRSFDFVAGAYYLHEHNQTDNLSIVYPGLAPAPSVQYTTVRPDLHANSTAVFAQGSYHFGHGISLTLGGRYTHDVKDDDQSYIRYDYSHAPTVGAPVLQFPAHVRPRWSNFTPKAGIEWQIDPHALVYASYTEGFKSGGTNYAAFTQAGLSYQPEHIKSYEIGLKSQVLDNRVRMNLSGFLYDYDNLQVQQNLSPGNVQVTNAATARVKGVEAELTARPVHALVLSASGTYLDARYRDFPTASVPSALAAYIPATDPRFHAATLTYDASGNRMNNAPKFAYVLSARYTLPIGDDDVYLSADYHWQSRTQFDPSNAAIVSQPGYGLLGMALGFDSRDKVWNVQITARNLLDKDYLVVRAANGLRPSGLSGAPRTVMGSISRHF